MYAKTLAYKMDRDLFSSSLDEIGNFILAFIQNNMDLCILVYIFMFMLPTSYHFLATPSG